MRVSLPAGGYPAVTLLSRPAALPPRAAVRRALTAALRRGGLPTRGETLRGRWERPLPGWNASSPGGNPSQVGTEKRSDQLLAEQVGQSRNQIQRYIRLTELIPELLDMVDEKKIAFNPAYELSFLKEEEQTQLLDAMDSEQATPSLSQAQRLKKFSQEDRLSIDVMRAIMGEEKKSDLDKVTFTSDTLRKYFPKSYTPQRMQETIIKLLEQWQRRRQQQHDR